VKSIIYIYLIPGHCNLLQTFQVKNNIQGTNFSLWHKETAHRKPHLCYENLPLHVGGVAIQA